MIRRILCSTPSLQRQAPAIWGALTTTTPFGVESASGVAKRWNSKPAGGSKPKKKETARSRDLEMILKALDAPKTKPPVPDEEEKERREKILKAYTIGCFQRHNEENHDLACKIKLKKHAMKMLPRNSSRNSTLKEKALQIDTSSPPRWRRIPAWTPPIPGFDPNQFLSTEEQ